MPAPLTLAAVRLDDRLVPKRGRAVPPVTVAMIHRKDRALDVRAEDGGRVVRPVRELAREYRIERGA